jgi:hypothetical protein
MTMLMINYDDDKNVSNKPAKIDDDVTADNKYDKSI